MRHTDPTHDIQGTTAWIYSETIDEELSAISVHGRVGALGVDLLRGTIEELSRRGHQQITVTIEHRDDVDSDARTVLAEVSAHVARRGGRLTLEWSEDQVDSR
jgi:hypothetical protein